jgi:hypothetical protein
MLTTHLSVMSLTKLTEFYAHHSLICHGAHKTYRVLCSPLTYLSCRSQNVQSSMLTTHLSAMELTNHLHYFTYKAHPITFIT